MGPLLAKCVMCLWQKRCGEKFILVLTLFCVCVCVLAAHKNRWRAIPLLRHLQWQFKSPGYRCDGRELSYWLDMRSNFCSLYHSQRSADQFLFIMSKHIIWVCMIYQFNISKFDRQWTLTLLACNCSNRKSPDPTHAELANWNAVDIIQYECGVKWKVLSDSSPANTNTHTRTHSLDIWSNAD